MIYCDTPLGRHLSPAVGAEGLMGAPHSSGVGASNAHRLLESLVDRVLRCRVCSAAIFYASVKTGFK
jgi:hypothetical protein